MNKSDSERIAASLEKKGYKPASKENTADLIVVNMCSVRQSAVDRVFGLVQKFNKLKDQNSRLRQGFGRQAKPKTILTGCILKVDKKKFENKFDLITNKEEYLKCPPKYQDKNIALVPISNGCNNFCTYCVVPFTRGRLVCRSYKEIIQEVKNAVKKGTNPIRNAISNGAREIWLLGQNVNDYHSPTDSTVNFAKLLKMVNGIPGDFKIRIMSPNPKNFSDELIEVMAKSEKFSRYLNLPVQSGDNEILKKMNRPYIVEQYKNLVRKIIKKIPDINLSTDIIVGFPGETKKQFENTVKLFREIKFDMAYIAKYSPRPGTAAFLMKDNVPFKEKKRRWKILNDIILKTMESKGGAEKPKLVVILGPTASGKSDLAVKLAKNFKGEIISADSRQVYQGLNIGTAKPAKKERKLIKHHLINIRKPNQSYTVWEYKREAISAINQIIKKERIPILCGGTGFYI